MGGKTSRNKGQRGEREVIKLLQPIVDKVCEEFGRETIRLQRNLMQSDSGGYDISNCANFALEIKFQETFNLNNWWAQTIAQASAEQLPVLIYRKSRVPWRVRTFGSLVWKGKATSSVVDIALEDFLVYFELMCREEFNNQN